MPNVTANMPISKDLGAYNINPSNTRVTLGYVVLCV